MLILVIVIFFGGITLTIINQKPQPTYSEQLYQEFHCYEVWNWLKKNENNFDYRKVYEFKACGDDYIYEFHGAGKSKYWEIRRK